MSTTTDTRAAIKVAAIRYAQAGRRVVIAKNKNPGGYLGKSWQDQATSDSKTVERWFRRWPDGWVGLATGGGDELLDFDNKGNPDAEALLADWKQSIPADLLARLPIEPTQGGGFHIWYHCDGVDAGNTRLATRPLTDDEFHVAYAELAAVALQKKIDQAEDPELTEADADKIFAQAKRRRVTLIETRGKGGFGVVAPSPGYRLVQGDLTCIPTITREERKILWDAARALDQAPERATRTTTNGAAPEGGDVIAAFNAAHDLRSILEDAGYTANHDRSRYTRPGGERDLVQIIADGAACIQYSGDDLLEPERPYDAFGVWCEHEHQGDAKAAVKAAAAALGMAHERTEHPAPTERDGWFFHPDTNQPLTCGPKALCAFDDGGVCVYWYTPERYDQAGYKRRYKAWKRSQANTGDGDAVPVSAEQASRAASCTTSIDITDENLGRVTDAIWQMMQASAYGPDLYKYGTEIAYHNGTLTTLTAERWRGMVNRVAAFEKTTEGKGTPQVREVLPPVAMIQDSLLFAPESLPVIERIAPLPVFNAQGNLLANGYYPDDRTLVESDITPSPMSPQDALSLLVDDLLVDFPFAAQADKANTLAYILAPFVRDMCGAVPLFLIDAAQRGTGKSLLNDLVHTIWTGQAATVSDLPLNAEEQRKQLTTHLLDSPFSVVFDDISLLAGHHIQRALTGTTWKDRTLGVNKNIVIPIRCIFAATGNNVTLGGDMPRRAVLIRLESTDENPSQRTGFKRTETELRLWVRDHRAALVSACIALIQHGLAHGAPGDITMGGFDAFAQTMATILNGCGVVGFYENMTAAYAREDSRQTDWKALVWQWWATYADQPTSAHAIADLIESDDECGILLDGETQKAKDTSTGRLLRGKVGTVYAFESVRLQIKQTKDNRGKKRYQLEDITPKDPPPDAPPAPQSEESDSEIPHQDAIPPHSPHSPHSDPNAHAGAHTHARAEGPTKIVCGPSGLCGGSALEREMSPPPPDSPPPAPPPPPGLRPPPVNVNARLAQERDAIRAAADADELGLERAADGRLYCWRVNGTTARLSDRGFATQAELATWLGVPLAIETDTNETEAQ